MSATWLPIFLSFGLSLFPIGLSFLLPVGRMARYGVLLFFFCVCQLGVCIFSTYAITLIQQRTHKQLMGKVMSCVFTLSMCAQPVGQVVYGRAVRLLFRQRLLGAHPHRCAHLPDSGGVAGFFEKDGGGRVKQKGHLQKQMSFF